MDRVARLAGERGEPYAYARGVLQVRNAITRYLKQPQRACWNSVVARQLEV